MPDITLRPRDASQSTYDAQLYPQVPRRNDARHIVRLYPRDASRGTYDVQLRPANLLALVSASAFPTQYDGFYVRRTSGTQALCLVATADAPSGMGGQLRFYKGGVTYAVYLVETTDPNASPLRIQTTTGIKAVRVKT